MAAEAFFAFVVLLPDSGDLAGGFRLVVFALTIASDEGFSALSLFLVLRFGN